MSSLAVIALGSNLGDRLAQLRFAVTKLAARHELVVGSPVYANVAIGPEQPDYLNAVMLVRTELDPLGLLADLLAVERSMGRVRDVRFGPRKIDLDLIAFDDVTLDVPGLTLPHPRAHERAFVLRPLADIAPELVLPGRGTVRDLLEALPAAARAALRPFTSNL